MFDWYKDKYNIKSHRYIELEPIPLNYDHGYKLFYNNFSFSNYFYLIYSKIINLIDQYYPI